MRYNRLVLLSNTTDFRIFFIDNFNCSISTAVYLTLLQSMTSINSSQIESSRRFKSGLLGGQRSYSINDGKLFGYTILVLSDLGVGLYHLVERSTGHQKLHSHILKLQKVVTMINSSFIQDHQRVQYPWSSHSTTSPLSLSEVLFLHDTTSSSPASVRFIVYTRSFSEL